MDCNIIVKIITTIIFVAIVGVFIIVIIGEVIISSTSIGSSVQSFQISWLFVKRKQPDINSYSSFLLKSVLPIPHFRIVVLDFMTEKIISLWLVESKPMYHYFLMCATIQIKGRVCNLLRHIMYRYVLCVKAWAIKNIYYLWFYIHWNANAIVV